MTDTPASAESSPPIVIERVLDAPIALVWSMWTDPDRFAQWYGPRGARIPVADMDVNVGGQRFIGMEVDTPGGSMQMWFIGEYQEVSERRRLVYTESVADAEGNPLTATDMGMPAGHPMTTTVVVEFEELGERTRMVMTHHGVPAGSPGAMGWTMAIDKLVALLDET